MFATAWCLEVSRVSDRIRVSVRIRFSVWFVSCYEHVSVLLSVGAEFRVAAFQSPLVTDNKTLYS